MMSGISQQLLDDQDDVFGVYLGFVHRQNELKVPESTFEITNKLKSKINSSQYICNIVYPAILVKCPTVKIASKR